MLLYKAWLETRLRFLICLIGITCLCVDNIAQREAGLTSSVNLADYYSLQHNMTNQLVILWLLGMNLTTMGGLLREKAVGAASLTLALPFSRARLADARIATALAQALAMLVVPWAAILAVGSAIGKAHLLQQALLHLLFLTGGGLVYFAIAFLASCLFEGEYTALVVSFGVTLISDRAQPPGLNFYNPLAFMTGGDHYAIRQGLLLGPIPWAQIAVYGVLSMVLLLVSVKAIQMRGILIMLRTVLAAGLLIWISGVAYGAEPSFDVASIKPSVAGAHEGLAIQPGGRFVANGVSLKLLIGIAWHLKGFEMVGGDASWMTDDVEYEATAGDVTDVPAVAPPNIPEPIAVRVRSLLAERFAVKTHRETRSMRVYTLTVSPGGSRLEAVALSAPFPVSFRAGPGAIIGSNCTMEQFITILSRYMDRPLIDKTGFTGLFNAKLQFAPESAPRQLSGSTEASAGEDPSIFAAVQEQLGLKLETAQEPVEVLVVDSAERPSGN